MERRVAKRTRKRIACEFTCGDRRHSGIVLDLSETGIFIQTTATLRHGERLDLTLNASEPVCVHGTVARRMVVPPNLSQVAKGGIGVKLIRPPAAYRKLFVELKGLVSQRPGVGSSGSSESSSRKSSAKTARRRKKSPPPSTKRQRFRVVVSRDAQEGSRAYVLDCANEEEAKKRALRAAGPGWSVETVEVP